MTGYVNVIVFIYIDLIWNVTTPAKCSTANYCQEGNQNVTTLSSNKQPIIVKVPQMFDYIFKNENLHFHSMGQCYVRGWPFPI